MDYCKKIAVCIFLCIQCTVTYSMQYNYELKAKEEYKIHKDWMDYTKSPEKNFYLYSVGNWIKKNHIPPDHRSLTTFSILDDHVYYLLNKKILNLIKNNTATPGSLEKKMCDLYISGMV